MRNQIFRVDDEVKAALDGRKPVVALESTVIAHGLPRPTNLETARRLEQMVRENGATPATIAILEGEICVGLNESELCRIAESKDIRKISIRDLPVAVADRACGATTVASTLWIAHRAGIEVFATGGIGGVHRGPLPDISADLPQLAQTPIVVVCSGSKIVLDVPATREWLETYGITVIGYGCDDFPAFYSRSSRLQVDVRRDSPAGVAAIVKAKRLLGINSALLVTVPVPAPAEVSPDRLSAILEAALKDAEVEGIKGSETTPFLLAALAQKSDGATLLSNVALLENNARVAALVARALLS